MPRALICCGLLALIAGCNQGSADSPSSGDTDSGAWKDFGPEKDRFSVRMPGVPKPQTNPEGLSQAWASEAGGVTYRIGYKELFDPSVSDDLAKSEAFFDTFTDTLKFAQETEVVEEKKHINIAGGPGREIVGTTPDKKLRRIRITLAGGRYYQIDVAGTKEAVNSPDVEVFFNSLKLTH